jgi:DNA-binding MarR family transcriptional regulator
MGFISVTGGESVTIVVPRWFKEEFKRIKNPEAPLCACGCGMRVGYSYQTGRWAKYVLGHNKMILESKTRLLELHSKLPDRITQKELREMLGVSSKDASRIARRLVSLGLASRERVLHNRRWTFILVKLEGKAKTAERRVKVHKKQLELIGRARAIYQKLVSRGFLRLKEVPISPRNVIMSGKFGEVPQYFKIGGVTASPRSKSFSTYHLFGKRIKLNYLVLDMEKFKKYISAYLERKFRARNPNPDRYIKRAFTQYMHGHNLHWSECCKW